MKAEIKRAGLLLSAKKTLPTSSSKSQEKKKGVAKFYSWEAYKVHLKKGDMVLKVLKDKEDKWHFESADKGEADEGKIKSFIREIESLEASEFIDPPLSLKDHGLDKPLAEIKIWTKEDEDPEKIKEITVIIGTEDEEAKKVVVKNARFDYFFKVDSNFLEDFPKEVKDWKVEEEED